METTALVLAALIGFIIAGPIGSLFVILIWWLVKHTNKTDQKK